MPPWDPGLQPERTELAWRRTILAATAGLAIAGRYAGASQPVLAMVLPALAVALGLVALRLVSSRVRAIDTALRAAGPDGPGSRTSERATARPMPGGGMLMATAGAAATALLAATWYVVSAAL
ncbi:DUF202 domain-containing protein [Bogoriella caseilytica]|uniref:Uncharacterized protein DUF202 n=1 Tax=Bogoriella caseilytica TaxID=56055 RepID=A0A3N2BEJ4_9MICO|nr:DUF202 domain-containing protein [Bogoriella caseilytica]ROR73677.1 uncharacterized protein DUF202 [Bogoriella caseilytica]